MEGMRANFDMDDFNSLDNDDSDLDDDLSDLAMLSSSLDQLHQPHTHHMPYQQQMMPAALVHQQPTAVSYHTSSSIYMQNPVVVDESNKRKRPSTSGRVVESNRSVRKRKCRTTFTKSQLAILEQEFLKYNFISNDKVDMLVELTGLDARIIKNWFKNKRSRVLSDGTPKSSGSQPPATCSNNSQSTSSASLTTSKQVDSTNEHQFHTTVVNSTPSVSSSSNTNLNNLVNIVNSIDGENNNANNNNNSSTIVVVAVAPPVPPTCIPDSKNSCVNRTDNEIGSVVDHADVLCMNCMRVRQELCVCSVSKPALNRLYRPYYSDFVNNSIHFNQNQIYTTNQASFTEISSPNQTVTYWSNSSPRRAPYQQQSPAISSTVNQPRYLPNDNFYNNNTSSLKNIVYYE